MQFGFIYRVTQKRKKMIIIKHLNSANKMSMTFLHSSIGIAFVVLLISLFKSRILLGYGHRRGLWDIPRNKNLGGLIRRPLWITLATNQPVKKRWFNHANDIFEVCCVAPPCWKHWRTLTTSFRRPSAVQNLRHLDISICVDCLYQGSGDCRVYAKSLSLPK